MLRSHEKCVQRMWIEKGIKEHIARDPFEMHPYHIP